MALNEKAFSPYYYRSRQEFYWNNDKVYRAIMPREVLDDE